MQSDDDDSIDENQSSNQSRSNPLSETQLLQTYTNQINTIPLHTKIYNIDEQILKHHRIIMNHNTNLQAMLNAYDEDCYMTIKKKHHYGTHCLYDVVLGNFSLEIHLLNLHRSSDDRDASISLSELGSGGFGTVRSVKVGNNAFAVKRINFMKKMVTLNGFDFELQNAEFRQIKRAIREYCIYKICSMYKIGPEIMFRKNYDLVCYNNCLQFFMEECQIPNKNPSFMRLKGLSADKLKNDLTQNLKVLHFLKMVHKDIKPDNILYSETMKRFVFTDFGLTHAVKQTIDEKSLTSYAGTIDYWSPEMMILYRSNKEKGYVNLYLNDFYGLKLTISKIEKQSKKSNNLSRNIMSQDVSYSMDQVSFGQSLQHKEEDDSKEKIIEQETSYSYLAELQNNEKILDNIYIKSTTSLDAPIKYASQINFYQAIILYELFRIKQIQFTLSPQYIKQKIKEECQDVENQFIYQEVQRYIIEIFYPKLQSRDNELHNLNLEIISLKNTARNLGPKSQQTINQLQKIMNQSKSLQNLQIFNYFKTLKDDIINNKDHINLTKLSNEMMIHLYLKNYHYLFCCCMRMMRQLVHYKNQKKGNYISEDNLMFVCKSYIICNMIGAMNIIETNTMNFLFIQIWDHDQRQDLIEFVNKNSEKTMNIDYHFKQNPYTIKIVSKLIKFACDYIIQHKEEHYMEIFFAFQFYSAHFKHIDSKDYQFYVEWIQKYLNDFVENEDKDSLDKRFSRKVEQTKIYRKLYLMQQQKGQQNKYLKKVKGIVDDLYTIQDKKFYFACALQLILMYQQNNQEKDIVLQLSFKILKELEMFKCSQIEKRQILIRINKIVGDTYLAQQEYQQSIVYLKLSQRFIVDYYGMENAIHGYYDCRNNIALAYFKLNFFKESLKIYEELVEFIEKTNMIMVAQKALLYRSIIHLKLTLGITKQDYPQIDCIIKIIVYQTIYTIITVNSAYTSTTICKPIDLQTFNFINSTEDIIHKTKVMQIIVKYIQDQMQYFRLPYYKINYRLYNIYKKNFNQPTKALRYIWNYIKVKLYDRHIQDDDVKLMNKFVGELIVLKYEKRALMVINKYIFRIPLQFGKQRMKAYKLMHTLHCSLKHPLKKVTYILTINNCQALRTNHFTAIYSQPISLPARLNNLLLKKWQHKI